MRITIENFGPVDKFEFDTDKLIHLIVGNNNVGKSYALTAYYFATKTLLQFATAPQRLYHYDDLVESEDPCDKKMNDELISRIRERKTTEINVKNYYVESAKYFLRHSLAESFTRQIKSSFHEFESIVNQFSKSEFARVVFNLPGMKIVLKGNIDEFKVEDVEFGFDVVLRNVKQNRSPMHSNGKLVIYKNISDEPEDVLRKIQQMALHQIVQSVMAATENIADISYLPASRSGLYQALSAFGLIIAELSKNRSFITSKIELPGISGQLSDYFIKLTSIVENASGLDNSFEDIADKIEATVLKGKIEYDYERKKLYYRPENTTLRLDLSATSSMVSEIGPIVAYIRHIISNKAAAERRTARFRRNSTKGSPLIKQILIIEEPEAHLHPENQIKMTELYAELTKVGVHLIMTSHSNYVFNKVSNLVMAKTLLPSQVRCDLFEVSTSGSRGVQQVIDEYGIDDSNFVDASELILNEKLDLISKMSGVETFSD